MSYDETDHGKYSTYTGGCRCDECRAASSEYARQRRARLGFVSSRTASRSDPFEARFQVSEDGCWQWVGNIDVNGYGRYRGGRNHVGTTKAHRIVYEKYKGPIPEGLTLDHLCRNRGCVNPDHLEPVTNAENVLRGVGQGALNVLKTHCKRGHEFTPENTLVSDGRRYCRTCKTKRDRDRWARVRAEGRAP